MNAFVVISCHLVFNFELSQKRLLILFSVPEPNKFNSRHTMLCTDYIYYGQIWFYTN